jgi:subtilisin family serine protease
MYLGDRQGTQLEISTSVKEFVMIVPGRLLVSRELLGAGGIANLNEVLFQAGLDRPLQDVEVKASAKGRLVEVPVLNADPRAVVDVLRARVSDPSKVCLDVRYQAPTFGDETAGRFELLGKKTGHGVASWEPATKEQMGDKPDWDPPAGGPVIAILDSGVREDHPWLPQDERKPFVTEADDWEPDRALDLQELPELDGLLDFGSHLGHGTFVAGIIRRVAPTARILSLKVMDSLGQVNEENVLSALSWLAERKDKVDVVLMAFGRKVEDGDDNTESAKGIKQAITKLAGRGTLVVMSAGNARFDDPVFPACFAREAGRGVASVGGGLSKYLKEEYSSFGDWVTDWRLGGEVVSLMPLTPEAAGLEGVGYARWSGTSFSAAIFAAQRAAGHERSTLG